MSRARRSAPAVPRSPRASLLRDVALIVALLGIITVLHLFTSVDGHHFGMHLLFRKLYFVPIVYAGLVFGWRGGLLVAIAAALIFAPHAALSMGGLVGPETDNLYEMAMYLVIGGLFGWAHDLEERKTTDLRRVSLQLEDAYRVLEERAIQLVNIQDYTQSILRSITSGVITTGPDGSVATANPAAERMVHLREGDMVPHRFATLFADDGGLSHGLERILEGRTPKIVMDTRIVTQDRVTMHAQVAMSQMRDIGGHVIGAVVTLEDVSEIKALTDQLIRADRLAAMGELTAGVAHEVRNPLGIIRASVQLLEDAGCDPARTLEATGVIKQEIDRLDKVIKALLDFGRPSTPTFRDTDIGAVIADVVMFTRKFASQSRVQIEVVADEDVLPVPADADQLKQVLVNLISNAVQAMQESGGRIVVRVSNADGYVTITVADNGPGIPGGDLAKVFDPFYSTKDDGTGLGLTIVHRIIDQHGGRIEVDSTEGEGTTFLVSLPTSNA